MPDTRFTGLLHRLHARLVPAPVAGQTDRDALRAFVAHKDETAFAVLVHRHGPMVLRVCQRVLHHAQDAEDAFQATFLVLARKAASVGRSESLPSWLHGVALRTALRARRDAGRRRAREAQAPVAVAADPLEDLAWRDVQVLLEAEIRRLPERYRAPFVLCHLEGRGRAEAAADLGIEENTLSSRLARARDRLKRRLGKRGINLPAALAAVALTTEAAAQGLPPELSNNLVRSAALFAAGQPATGVSSFTLQLTSGAMQTMAITKLKWAAAVLAVGGTLVVGTWGAGQGPGSPGGRPTRGGPPGPGMAGEKPAAVTRTADYAQRQRSLKNLRQLLIAMHNYHDAHGRFPADVTDPAGKPLLSWRVELLPYLEQDALYKRFKRDESWDSEHNLALLAQMPEVLRVGFEPKGATHTYYQRFTITGAPGGFGAMGDGASGLGPLGPAAGGGGAPPGGGGPGGPPGMGGALPGPGAPGGGPMFPPGFGGPPGAGGPGMPGMPGMGPGPGGGFDAGGPPGSGSRFPLRMAEISDGTSNTLGLVEAGPPVPWTKPADIAYDAARPLPPLTGPFANVRNAATLDGQVHSLRPDLNELTWRRLIEPNDGQVFPAVKSLRARFAADSEEEKRALAQLLAENQKLIEAVESQTAESAALLGLTNKVTRDLDRAEDLNEKLTEILNVLKVRNKKLRDEIGLRPGSPVPKGQ